MDVSKLKVVESIGRKEYATRVYFMRHKSDAAEYFGHFSRG